MRLWLWFRGSDGRTLPVLDGPHQKVAFYATSNGAGRAGPRACAARVLYASRSDADGPRMDLPPLMLAVLVVHMGLVVARAASVRMVVPVLDVGHLTCSLRVGERAPGTIAVARVVW